MEIQIFHHFNTKVGRRRLYRCDQASVVVVAAKASISLACDCFANLVAELSLDTRASVARIFMCRELVAKF